jgi:hypothetical protein
VNASPATSYKDSMIESLRIMLQNQEVVIKESDLIILLIIMIQMHLKQQQKDIFKWCKKLNLIDFEPAIPEDEYFSNLQNSNLEI